MVDSIPFVFGLVIPFLDDVKPTDIGTGLVILELNHTRFCCFKHDFY